MRPRVATLLLVWVLLATQPASPVPQTSTKLRKEVRRVLIFNELGLWSPGVAAINKEIFAALEESPFQVEFYSEDLDTSLFPKQASQLEFREWYFRKYENRKPDLIIAIGPSAMEFMSDSHQTFSPTHQSFSGEVLKSLQSHQSSTLTLQGSGG